MPLPGLRAGKRGGAGAFVLLSLVLLMWSHLLPPLQPPFPLPVAPGSSLVPDPKPGNITVSGLVFYGRRDRASCLRCYLEENMVGRGGWLDEILWVVNTEEEDDLRYLEEIIASDPGRHKALYLPGETLSTYTYYKAWQRLDRGKYYVKVDDDIVWIADDAIPRLISQKLDHPECFAVSANVINNPPLGFIHYHVGALHPYLPEVAGPESNISTTSWKPSLLRLRERPVFQGLA